jgi:prophage regulatory protein
MTEELRQQLDDAQRPLRILRLREVKAKTGRSQSSIYADMAEDKFPRAIPIGGHSVGWLETEIDDWIRSRVAERDAAVLENPNGEPKTDAERGAVEREIVRKVAQSKTDW